VISVKAKLKTFSHSYQVGHIYLELSGEYASAVSPLSMWVLVGFEILVNLLLALLKSDTREYLAALESDSERICAFLRVCHHNCILSTVVGWYDYHHLHIRLCEPGTSKTLIRISGKGYPRFQKRSLADLSTWQRPSVGSPPSPSPRGRAVHPEYPNPRWYI